MAEVQATTKRMFVPKFDKVCDVNVTDETLMREQYNAIDESAYLAGLAKASGNPFKNKGGKKDEKTDETDPTAGAAGTGEGAGEGAGAEKASKAAGK